MTSADQGLFLDGQESLSELIALLGHSSLRIRRGAVAALAQRPCAEMLQPLLGALASPDDATVRNAAADVFVRLGQSVVSGLVRAMEPSSQRDLTIQVLVILGKIPSREAVDAAIPLATHSDPSIAAGAIACLGAQKDPSCVPTLLDVLASGERWQSFYAIDALGEVGHVAAVSRLIPLIEEPYYRKAVLRAMGRIGDESVIRPLVKAMLNVAPVPERTALVALNEMVDRARTSASQRALVECIRAEMRQWDVSRLLPGLHAFMEGGDDKRRRYALRALTWMQDPETIPALVEALSDPFVAEVAADGLAGLAPAHCTEILQSSSHIPLPAEALQRIVGVVGALSREDVDRFLEEALEHENDDVRQAAAAEMSARVEAHHLENLVQALGDTSPLVSQEAIHGLLALARQSESQRHQVAGRVEGLTASTHAEMRCAALAVVARLEGADAQDALDLALHDPVAAVRRTAVSLLGEGCDPERLWRLTAALADEDARVREEAVRSVGRLQDGRARGVLLAALHDRSIWVRCRAAEALAEHPAVEVQAALEDAARREVAPVKVSAIAALGRFWPESREALRHMADDEDPEIRRAALRAVAACSKSDATDWLVAGLEDADWTVRCAAAEGLGQASLPGAFTPLALAFDRERDAVVRQAVMTALFRADREASLPYLVSALTEKDVAETAAELMVAGFQDFADELRAEWAGAEDPAVREGLAVVLREGGRRGETTGDSQDRPL